MIERHGIDVKPHINIIYMRISVDLLAEYSSLVADFLKRKIIRKIISI